MSTFYNLAIVVQVLSALAIIVLVLLQHGKGADMGAAFGSGASGSLFGATGNASFFSRATAVAATIFFVATLGLSVLASQRTGSVGGGVMDSAPVPAPVQGSAAIPSAATPAPAAAPAASVPAAVEAAPAAPAAEAPAAAAPAASPAK